MKGDKDRDRPDGGYEDHQRKEEEKEEDRVVFTAERLFNFYLSSGGAVRVLRNGEPVGIIRAMSEGEIRYLSARISGEVTDEYKYDRVSD